MSADAAVSRLIESIHDPRQNRGAARDIVSHLQCFDAHGKPLFTSEQISRICEAVGQQATQAAEEGDDRRLKRMLEAMLKLSTVNRQLRELDKDHDAADELIARLRDRQREANAN